MFNLFKFIRPNKTARKARKLQERRTALLRANKCPYCEISLRPCQLLHKQAGWRPGVLCPDKHYGFIYFSDYSKQDVRYAHLDNLGEALEITDDRIRWGKH
jgi:hypothetical protein